METQKIVIRSTEDAPTHVELHHRISMTALLRRTATVWGSELAQTFRLVLDDLFTGQCYCREYPREITLDHPNNCLWVFTYNRPKQLDPLAETLSKYVIELPPEIPVVELLDYQFNPIQFSWLESVVEWDHRLADSTLPLLGLPGFDQVFCHRGQVAAQQGSNINSLGGNVTYTHEHEVVLVPTMGLVDDRAIATWVSQNTFMRYLKGEHPHVVQMYRTLMTYLKAIDVTPTYHAVKMKGRLHLSIIYVIPVVFADDTEFVVTGSLNTNSTLRLNYH